MLKSSGLILKNLALTFISIFFILPYNLVIDHKLDEFYNFQLLFTNLSLLIFSLILITLITFGSLYFFPKIKKKILLLSNFILIWIFFIGYFFPITGEHDPFLSSIFSIKLRYVILIKLTLILVFFLILEQKNFIHLLRKLILFYILINLIFIFYNFALNYQKTFFPKINIFGEKNLIVLSLDGISGKEITKKILEDDEFRKELEDFKLFNNVTSAWPATVNSLNAELNSKVVEINDYNLSKNILNDKKFNTIVYGNYKHFVNEGKRKVFRGHFKEYGRSYKLNSFFQKVTVGTFARWGSPLLLPIFENKIFYSKIYKRILDIIAFDLGQNDNPYNSGIHTRYMVHMKEFDNIFHQTKLDLDVKNVIRMYHFSFSHWPIRLNEKCEEVKSLDLKLTEQERVAVSCLSEKIKYFIRKLKEEKIYSNSFIVIKSDHGKPNGYYNEFPLKLRINESRYWGLGRYKTFLMIKNIDKSNNEIEIITKHIFLHDLAKTYCSFFYKETICDKKYIGNDLNKNIKEFTNYKYEIFIPNKKETFLKLEDFDKYMIKNDKSLYESLLLNNIKLTNEN